MSLRCLALCDSTFSVLFSSQTPEKRSTTAGDTAHGLTESVFTTTNTQTHVYRRALRDTQAETDTAPVMIIFTKTVLSAVGVTR